MRKPNILWIGLDQIRRDTPGCYGNSVCQTPNIDRLAREGVVFDRAYTTCSLCTPARASMLTGRFAFAHKMLTNCDMYHYTAAELPDPSLLLHTRIQSQGYRCGFIGKWHVGTKLGPVDYGFEGMNVGGYGNIRREPGFLDYLKSKNLSYTIQPGISANPGNTTLLTGLWDGPAQSTPPYYLAERTIGLLESFSSDSEPFFLTCQFWGPHQPCFPSREYAGMHDRKSIEPWINYEDSWKGKPDMVRRTHTDFYRGIPENWEAWREVVGSYYDFTTMIDAQIGGILDKVDQLGIADNTLIILSTDHGDMTGSHGGMNDKGYLYEEAHRIPLILSWPGKFPDGTRRNQLVYNMDILPTMLDIVGQSDDGLHGKTLLPFIEDRTNPASRTELLLEFHGIRFLYSQRAVVTEDGWKYIFTPGDKDEVYDLNEDPGELDNLLDEHGQARRSQDKVAELRQRLIEITAKAGDPLQMAVAKFFGVWTGGSSQPEPSRI